ncbi:MAG: hypothetical protein AB7I48_10205 [Planctomycetaceae bacterium]
MPLAATAQPAYFAPSAFVWTVDASIDERFQRVFTSDAIRSTLSELCVAGMRYPLRAPSRTSYIPVAGEFLVEGFSPLFVGRGTSQEEARENWLLAVHASFQELLHKRPFEMTADDRLTWSVLSSRIDVAVYRNQTPIQVRQFGRVRFGTKPYPSRIEWEDGSRDAIKIDQVAAPDFVTFKPGQPIEAVVARDPVDFHLLRIVHVERRSEPARLSADEEAELLESIGSATTLPVAGWE